MKKYFFEKMAYFEEEGDKKYGEDLSYWHGGEAWNVFQMKERRKLRGEGFSSFRTKKILLGLKKWMKKLTRSYQRWLRSNYWHGEEAREVSQSKERQKLGWEGKMSFGTKKMDIMDKKGPR